MSIYGYNRVSTKEQHLDRGRKTITEYCEKNSLPLVKIFEDVGSGTNFERHRYIVLKEDVIQSGDIIIVPEYDRLGRADETKAELEHFKKIGVRIIFLDIPTTYIDVSSMPDEISKMILTCINDMMISFFDVLARSELDRKRKRQREGIEAKKARGEWSDYGRPRKMSKEAFAKQYERVLRGEIRTLALQRELQLKKETFFNYIREYKAEHQTKGVENG